MFQELTPDILERCAYDDVTALQYAETYQGMLVSICFDWLEERGIEAGDGFICPQCHQFTQYTARCYFRDDEDDTKLCLSVICIKDGIQQVARQYLMQRLWG